MRLYRVEAAELRTVARKLMAMADELDPPRRRWPAEPAAEVDEVAQARALAKLKKLGLA